MKFIRYIVFTVVLFFNIQAKAQIDTIFWFAAPEVSNSLGDQPIFLRFLTYDNSSDIQISLPANGAFIPINLTIPANSVQSVDLTPFLAQIESPAADVVSNNGIKITSTQPVGAFYEVFNGSNKEVFSLKGNTGMGTNFYTPFQRFWNNGSTTPASFCSIDIVAVEDNTTVLITPRTNIVGHPANTSFSVVLDEGETYSARDINVSAATSLTGSIVSSNKPISVTVHSGALSNTGCLSTVGDQITTADFAGRKFIIHKGNLTNERVYIMAVQNSTTINVYNSGTTSTLINWSETYEYALTEDINYIETNKPVYVFHTSGKGCQIGGAQVPNLLCAGTYSTAFTRSNTDSIGVILYTRSGFEDDFAINGNTSLINPLDFDDVPGTSGEFKVGLFYFNTTDVPVGSYNEVTNTGDVFGLGILTGQSGNGVSYAYLSEFNSYPFVEAGLNDTVCANVPFPVNGIVGGGSITGTWGGSGFGSFQSSLTTLNNVYIPSNLDTIISPVNLILTSTGPCPVQKDTLVLYVKPAPIVNASADQTVCENNSDVQLNGNVFGGASTGEWSTLGTGTFFPNATTLNAVYTPSADDVAAGSVKLILSATDFGLCNLVTDTMNLTITLAPIVDAGPTSISVCSNNPSFSLSGSVTGSSTTGKWVTSGNGVFSPSNLNLNATYNPSPADIASGTITIYLESTSNGNCNKVVDSIEVIFTPSPQVDAGPNLLACTNEAAVNLNGTVTGGATTGIWSGGAGTFLPNNTDLNAEYIPTAGEISSGNIVLTLTSTDNETCTAVQDNVQINFVAPPFANFNFNNVCLGNVTNLTDFSLPVFGSIVNWEWNFGDGNSSTSQNNTHTYSNANIYSVELIVTTSVGCSDTSTQNITVYELPNANFTYSVNCENNLTLVDFTGTSTSTDNLNFWFYDFGGQGSIFNEDATQLFTGSGNFEITYVVGTVNNCRDTLKQILTVPPKPQAGFFYNTNNGLNIGAVFNFIDSSKFSTSYYWYFGDGNESDFQNPSNTYFSNGNYTVTQYVYNDLGCMDSLKKVININTVTTEINTLIPNAISPNGDGKNDVWKLDFLALLFPNATVEIYNRWGQLIYFTEGVYIPWDGTYNGEKVGDGTYYYIINLQGPGDPEPYKGSILVLKNEN